MGGVNTNLFLTSAIAEKARSTDAFENGRLSKFKANVEMFMNRLFPAVSVLLCTFNQNSTTSVCLTSIFDEVLQTSANSLNSSFAASMSGVKNSYEMISNISPDVTLEIKFHKFRIRTTMIVQSGIRHESLQQSKSITLSGSIALTMFTLCSFSFKK
uniref:Uncharacterized protein n=1 Tax=Romanomermis culicivorax TaxID=13658 RepID=A0A915HJB2_ROMCU